MLFNYYYRYTVLQQYKILLYVFKPALITILKATRTDMVSNWAGDP